MSWEGCEGGNPWEVMGMEPWQGRAGGIWTSLALAHTVPLFLLVMRPNPLMRAAAVLL